MARENQGLQIALIIFVMLTIVLGVTTYLFFRQYEEAMIKANNNLAERDAKAKLANDNEHDMNELKRMVGVAKTDKIDAITTQFNDDMKKFGGSLPEETRLYRPLLDKMSKTRDELSSQLADAKAQIQKLDDQFKVREASKQPQIDKFEKAADDASKDLAGERSKFQTERERITQEETKLQTDLKTARQDASATIAKIEAKLQELSVKTQKIAGVARSQADKLEQLTSDKIDVPEGEVLWANQHNGAVWINLGRADALPRQTTFSVYPADISDMSKGGKKASIEVVQVLGDHLAEGRVLDDKITDPIMPGDKIYTPVWRPGEQRHFALAGFMDIDGDGKSDLQSVVNLITMNGGVVDCYIDDKGKRAGEMTVNTRYLVLGEAPNEKGVPAMIAAFTKMRGDARLFGIQDIQLGDLLQRMGWKNQSAVTRYGRGGSVQNAHPKLAEPAKKSAGSSSDAFKPRTPPAKAPSSAY